MNARVWVGLIPLLLGLQSTARGDFFPLPLIPFFTESRAGLIGGNLYPTGEQTLGGVPYILGTNTNYCYTFGWGLDDNVHVVTIPLGITGIDRVFMLMNTEAGRPGPTSYIHVQFQGTGGASASYDLIGNVDVRDYNQDGYTNSINNTTTINVFSTGNGQRMDRVLFDLPPAFLSQSLTSMVITDNGSTFVEPRQRGILFGVTLDRVPEPGALGLLLVGGWMMAWNRRRC